MAYSSWKQLYEDVQNCDKCDLCKTRRHVVFGEGNPHADIMFIGEGPGEKEDEAGRPFVGPAGHKLDELLQGIGLAREDVYIANVVKCRPPNNRDPQPQEIQACMPFLRGQTAFVKPKIIVALGRHAAGLVLGRDVHITREHGQVNRIKSFVIIPTLHPAALLYNPQQVPMSEHDFQVIKEQLDAVRANSGSE